MSISEAAWERLDGQRLHWKERYENESRAHVLTKERAALYAGALRQIEMLVRETFEATSLPEPIAEKEEQ